MNSKSWKNRLEHKFVKVKKPLTLEAPGGPFGVDEGMLGGLEACGGPWTWRLLEGLEAPGGGPVLHVCLLVRSEKTICWRWELRA